MNSLVEVARSFKSMNTKVEVMICLPIAQKMEAEEALDVVQTLFLDIEQKLSRFRKDSELCKLNASAGQELRASSLLFNVVVSAINSARLTDGIFDPTILPYLEASGYDRSFESLDQIQTASALNHRPNEHNWNKISLNYHNRSIFLNAGCSLDLGGIAKSWTVDRVGNFLEKFQNYAVNAGGDMVVGGTQADGQPWTIGIGDPLDNENNLTILNLTSGAVCTSTTTKRKWLTGDTWQHHIIDPRTGTSSSSEVISATVIADSATLAETFTKAAIILGPQEGLKMIQKQDNMQALLVLKDGKQIASPGFPKIRSTNKKLGVSW